MGISKYINSSGKFSEKWVMQAATTNLDYSNQGQIQQLHEAKAAMAPGLASVVKEIAETGDNPENTLRDIIKLARLLDIAAPAARATPLTINDPRYNLLDYIKRSAGKLVIREINGDELLFDDKKPFTCISQIQEIFSDVSQKISRNFVRQVQYA